MTTRNQSLAELERKIDENRAESDARLAQMQESMMELRNLILAQAPGGSSNNTTSTHSVNNVQPLVNHTRNQTDHNQVRHYATRISKVDFPKFDGKKVQDWLYKCDRFFLLDETPPEARV
jgi:hypothetical protein